MSLLEKLQELIEVEVQKQISRYAQIISKKHDISLKLLLQDIPKFGSEEQEDVEVDIEPGKKGQCLGVTKTKKRCKFAGKNGGYCSRHQDQKKVVKKVESNCDFTTKHVGHTITDCLFLAGCPACEKTKGSRQNLLIDF
jgi:translation elongation factor EF-G